MCFSIYIPIFADVDNLVDYRHKEKLKALITTILCVL